MSNISSILEGLNEFRVNEGSVFYVVKYENKGIKQAEAILSTQGYNKIKETPGYKELDIVKIDPKTDNRGPKTFSHEIQDAIDKNKLGNLSMNGDVTGHFGEVGFGYRLYR